jgi:hypothetical protein
VASGSVYVWRRKAFGANTQEPCLSTLQLTGGVYPGGITLTGNVTRDFPATSPGVFVNRDFGLTVPVLAGMNASGWDMVDVRYLYDSVNDEAYFGTCTSVFSLLSASSAASHSHGHRVATCDLVGTWNVGLVGLQCGLPVPMVPGCMCCFTVCRGRYPLSCTCARAPRLQHRWVHHR